MIGGNVIAIVQIKKEVWQNELGEREQSWVDAQRLTGWLDLSSGDSKYTYNAKLQECTHVFLCDYVAIDRKTDDKRLTINGVPYDILWIDNPMELNQHLEILLRCVG